MIQGVSGIWAWQLEDPTTAVACAMTDPAVAQPTSQLSEPDDGSLMSHRPWPFNEFPGKDMRARDPNERDGLERCERRSGETLDRRSIDVGELARVVVKVSARPT